MKAGFSREGSLRSHVIRGYGVQQGDLIMCLREGSLRSHTNRGSGIQHGDLIRCLRDMKSGDP